MNLEESNAFTNFQEKARAEIEKQKAEEDRKLREYAEQFIKDNQEFETLYDNNQEFFDKYADKVLVEKLRVILPGAPYYDMNYFSGLRHGLGHIKNQALLVKNYKKQLKEV